MSGLEVIGIIASASQLVRYVLEIIDYTGNISTLVKGTSCPFQQHKEHLETLVTAVQTIRQTPLLQTRLIKSHLDSLLDRTEVLRSHLERYTVVVPRRSLSRIWTALLAHKAEGQILKDLATLEREKSNLLLCITSSYGFILHEIKESTDSGLVATKDSMSKATQDSGKQPRQASEQSGDTVQAQTRASSINRCQLTGNTYQGNSSTGGGSVVNRSGITRNLIQKGETYKENSADGKDSATLNGHADNDLIKAVLRRDRS